MSQTAKSELFFILDRGFVRTGFMAVHIGGINGKAVQLGMDAQGIAFLMANASVSLSPDIRADFFDHLFTPWTSQ